MSGPYAGAAIRAQPRSSSSLHERLRRDPPVRLLDPVAEHPTTASDLNGTLTHPACPVRTRSAPRPPPPSAASCDSSQLHDRTGSRLGPPEEHEDLLPHLDHHLTPRVVLPRAGKRASATLAAASARGPRAPRAGPWRHGSRVRHRRLCRSRAGRPVLERGARLGWRRGQPGRHRARSAARSAAVSTSSSSGSRGRRRARTGSTSAARPRVSTSSTARSHGWWRSARPSRGKRGSRPRSQRPTATWCSATSRGTSSAWARASLA